MNPSAEMEAIHTLLRRELGAVRRSVEAYPDESSLWAQRPGLPNSGGNIALHLAGNLQHYLGAVIAKSGYVRQRDLEFSRRNVPRAEVLAGLDAAAVAIDRAMELITPDVAASTFPEQVGGFTIRTGDFVAHVLSHLAYHLGQIDYHRRVVTGNSTGVNAVSVQAIGTK